MKIRPPKKGYDPVALTERINDFWVRTNAYKHTKKSRSEGKKFYFVDGPPSLLASFIWVWPGIKLSRILY